MMWIASEDNGELSKSATIASNRIPTIKKNQRAFSLMAGAKRP